MYWTNDYEELSTELRTSNEAQKEIILRAYDKARHSLFVFLLPNFEG